MGNIRVHRTIFIIVHIFRNDTLYICKRTGDIVPTVCFYFIAVSLYFRYYMATLCNARNLENNRSYHTFNMGNRRLRPHEYYRS